MKERPILFSGEMVRAILDGKKNQTRRVIKPQPKGNFQFSQLAISKDPPEEAYFWSGEKYGIFEKIKTGDRLWVRETWAPCIGGDCGPDNPVLYRADNFELYEKLTWKPSIFMPRWASRITLQVVKVRVERLQDISEEDAKAEGMSLDVPATYKKGKRTGTVFAINAKYKFAGIWNGINKDRGYSWESNPWVWVIEFRRIK